MSAGIEYTLPTSHLPSVDGTEVISDKTSNTQSTITEFSDKEVISPPVEEKLIIFDINGILCIKTKEMFDETSIERPCYWVTPRPGAKDLIETLMNTNGMNVAVWSSTTYPNASVMLEAAIGKELIGRLKFFWTRSRTELHPNWGKDETITEYATVKNLERVWDHAFFNRKFCWKNTIIVDDSWDKMSQNNSINCIVLDPYSLEKDDASWDTDAHFSISSRFNLLPFMKDSISH